MFQEWHPLGAVLYRKWQVYDIDWDEEIKLDQCLVCGAPFGGPVAIIPDYRKAGSIPDKPFYLSIYTSSGVLMSKIEWKEKPIMAMGWSDQEHLISVLENG